MTVARTSPIKPGMLIRGLRSDDDISTILHVDNDGTLWCANDACPSGATQMVTKDAAVRYPWEPEWRPVNKPKHEPARGDVYRYKEGGSLYMVSWILGVLVLVCVDEADNNCAMLGTVWSNTSVFGVTSPDAFEYVGHASDILKVEV